MTDYQRKLVYTWERTVYSIPFSIGVTREKAISIINRATLKYPLLIRPTPASSILFKNKKGYLGLCLNNGEIILPDKPLITLGVVLHEASHRIARPDNMHNAIFVRSLIEIYKWAGFNPENNMYNGKLPHTQRLKEWRSGFLKIGKQRFPLDLEEFEIIREED